MKVSDLLGQFVELESGKIAQVLAVTRDRVEVVTFYIANNCGNPYIRNEIFATPLGKITKILAFSEFDSRLVSLGEDIMEHMVGGARVHVNRGAIPEFDIDGGQ